MGTPIEHIKDGKRLHYSVGAIIEREGKILMMERRQIPLGFACPAGHVDESQTPEEALRREVKEETGLEIKGFKLLIEGDHEGTGCTRGVKLHHWYIYKVDAQGEPVKEDREARSMGWYTREEIKKLDLEPAWAHWLKMLKYQ